MKKNLPKKYLSEEAVKRALKIDSFRNLSKDKIMQFASMIPYVDKDVAVAIINQLPTFADFVKTAVSKYSQLCDKILECNKESQNAAVTGYRTVLDALAKKIEGDDVTEEQRKAITEDMLQVADRIAELDFQNKKFLEKMGNKILFGLFVVVAVVGAAIGINSAVGGKDDIPQLPDDNNDDSEDVEDDD